MGHGKLKTVLERVETEVAAGRLPVVIFDVDSTLVHTAYRHQAILRDFAKAEDLDWVGQIPADEIDWDPADNLLAGHAPDDVVRRFRDFWFSRFFSSPYLRYDRPYSGAVPYVQAVWERGAMVYYLTARDVEHMGEGTVESLTRLGFPLWRGRTTLHLKPHRTIEDAVHKRVALDDVNSLHGTVVATFENEPKNANLFADAFPEADNFWVDTHHAPDPEPLHPSILVTTDLIP